MAEMCGYLPPITSGVLAEAEQRDLLVSVYMLTHLCTDFHF